jgi:sulfur-oxidizing protein SoxX
MRIARLLLGTVSAAALVLTVSAADGFAKEKCKDGEVAKAADYKLTKGKNIDVQIEASLTGKPGDPKAGLKWMVHRRLGNCIACHEVKKILAKAKPGDLKSLKSYGFHGKIAPPLDGVASRYTEGELRLIVVNPKKAFPDADTIMPSFHVNSGFTKVHKDCVDHVILSAERVEDVVAYLKTLK